MHRLARGEKDDDLRRQTSDSSPHPGWRNAMRKLSLDLDSLAVESFATDRPVALRGTVQANEAVLASNIYSCVNSCFCPSHHNTECC
jgi:hypothetical protein